MKEYGRLEMLQEQIVYEKKKLDLIERDYNTQKKWVEDMEKEIEQLQKRQELIKACKEAYNNKDLKNAYKLWEQVFNTLDEDKKGLTNEEDITLVYKAFTDDLKAFTNQEVYDITDYGKDLIYREMGY